MSPDTGLLLDPALERRRDEAILRAHLALGEEPSTSNSVGGLGKLVGSLAARLDEIAPDPGWRSEYEARARQLEQLRGRHEGRMAALESIRGAVERLSEKTSPDEMLAGAPEALCTSYDLERALLSVIREGRMKPVAAFFRDDARGAERALESLAVDQPRLEHPLVETEALRRRRATIVTDAKVHPRVHAGMAEIMDWDSFVAAPIALSEVIGVIHADRAGGEPLEVLDGDVIWEFAAGLAEAYDGAVLRRSLRRQRTEMRDFVEWLGARSSELEDASMELGGDPELPPRPPGQLGVVASAPQVEDRVVFEDLLTRRELEVLRLLARGESNRSIAARLVISPGTVKFHVSNILEKLHVGNRAEAVSRYHRLVEIGPRATSDSGWD